MLTPAATTVNTIWNTVITPLSPLRYVAPRGKSQAALLRLSLNPHRITRTTSVSRLNFSHLPHTRSEILDWLTCRILAASVGVRPWSLTHFLTSAIVQPEALEFQHHHSHNQGREKHCRMNHEHPGESCLRCCPVVFQPCDS